MIIENCKSNNIFGPKFDELRKEHSNETRTQFEKNQLLKPNISHFKKAINHVNILFITFSFDYVNYLRYLIIPNMKIHILTAFLLCPEHMFASKLCF